MCHKSSNLEYISFIQRRPFHNVSKVGKIGYELQAGSISIIIVANKTGSES